MPSRGILYVHSAPAALCPHLEWAVDGVLGVRLGFSWAPQAALPGTFRSEVAWEGPAGSAAAIASILRRWPYLRFEVTEDACDDEDGVRFAHTPSLGLFSATMSRNGDVLVSENQLQSARLASRSGPRTLDEELDLLLGCAWDEELESFRCAADDHGRPRLFQVG